MRTPILALIVVIIIAIGAIASVYLLKSPGNITVGVNTAQTPAQPNKIRVAVIYVTPVEEPWNQAMHEAMKWARDNLGIEYSYVERVSESDVERVIRQYIQAGYDIIIPHSWGYYQTTIKVAREFPNVFFAQGSGPTNIQYPSNVVVYDYWIQEAAYLAGIAAGKLTKSNIIGVVASYPVPDVVRLINAFAYGAKSVNPSVKIRAVFIESWYDPVKAKEAAKALIDLGADIIYSESYGATDAAEDIYKQGKVVYTFGTVIDYSNIAPNTLVASIVWDLKPFIKYLVELRKNGSWTSGILEWGMKEGWAKLLWNSRFAREFPEIVNYVEGVRKDILEGRLKVPIIENWDDSRWS